MKFGLELSCPVGQHYFLELQLRGAQMLPLLPLSFTNVSLRWKQTASCFDGKMSCATGLMCCGPMLLQLKGIGSVPDRA